MDTILWAVIFVVLLLIEIITVGLVTIWFAIGSIAALISTFFGANYYIQIGLFLGISLASLILTRPLVTKYMSKNMEKTNVDEIIGKEAIITKDIIGNEYGEAKLNGEKWLAKSNDGADLKEGDKVKITSVEGVKLVVEKV